MPPLTSPEEHSRRVASASESVSRHGVYLIAAGVPPFVLLMMLLAVRGMPGTFIAEVEDWRDSVTWLIGSVLGIAGLVLLSVCNSGRRADRNLRNAIADARSDGNEVWEGRSGVYVSKPRPIAKD